MLEITCLQTLAYMLPCLHVTTCCCNLLAHVCNPCIEFQALLLIAFTIAILTTLPITLACYMHVNLLQCNLQPVSTSLHHSALLRTYSRLIDSILPLYALLLCLNLSVSVYH